VSHCRSQACHSEEPELQLCLPQKDIIPPQSAQARFTPHQQQKLPAPAPAPPSYINSVPSQSPEPSEAAGGDHNQVNTQTCDTSGIDHQTSTAPKMIFSDLYKSPRSPFNKLRHSIPSVTLPATDLEADLISKDKARQKDAVKKFLNEKIRCDWDFVWPPVSTSSSAPAPDHIDEQLDSNSSTPAQNGNATAPIKVDEGSGDSVSPAPTDTASPTFDDDAPRDAGEEADSESDSGSVYSTVSEDQLHFHPRVEWTSDISDDDVPATISSSPFRFDNPDAVGTAVQSSIMERKARRRRAVRGEVAWNTGLACFEARRDAWTGARTVRVKPKPATPISPSSTRRLFWRHHRSESTASQNATFTSGSPPAVSSPLSPTSTHASQQTNPATSPSDPGSSNGSKATIGAAMHSTSSQESTPHALYPVETLIPVPPPLLPPQNPMRLSVTPSIYPSLYDKIVVHSLQPSCPVNLGDMLRACVVGWKRDGEWPPKTAAQVVPMPSAAEVAAIRQRRKAEQQQRHARKASAATNGSRRLSFVGFLSGSGIGVGSGNKGAGAEKDKTTATTHQHHEEKEGGGAAGGKDTHSDEAASSGKGIRRSLQRVFSLGHGHHATESTISPTKEVTAAG